MSPLPSLCGISGERPDPPNTLHKFLDWMPPEGCFAPTLHNLTLDSLCERAGPCPTLNSPLRGSPSNSVEAILPDPSQTRINTFLRKQKQYHVTYGLINLVFSLLFIYLPSSTDSQECLGIEFFPTLP